MGASSRLQSSSILRASIALDHHLSLFLSLVSPTRALDINHHGHPQPAHASACPHKHNRLATVALFSRPILAARLSILPQQSHRRVFLRCPLSPSSRPLSQPLPRRHITQPHKVANAHATSPLPTFHQHITAVTHASTECQIEHPEHNQEKHQRKRPVEGTPLQRLALQRLLGHGLGQGVSPTAQVKRQDLARQQYHGNGNALVDKLQVSGCLPRMTTNVTNHGLMRGTPRPLELASPRHTILSFFCCICMLYISFDVVKFNLMTYNVKGAVHRMVMFMAAAEIAHSHVDSFVLQP